MKRSLIYILFITGLILLPISGLTVSMPYLFNSSKGSIEVNWANPVGLKIDDLDEGDSLSLSYESEIDVSLYLLTRNEANEFRAPLFYKDPLPEPLVTGNNGSVEIDIEEDGDYELLFLPEEPSNTFQVDYELKGDLNRERSVYFLSGFGLLLTSMIVIVLGIVLLKKKNNDVMHK